MYSHIFKTHLIVKGSRPKYRHSNSIKITNQDKELYWWAHQTKNSVPQDIQFTSNLVNISTSIMDLIQSHQRLEQLQIYLSMQQQTISYYYQFCKTYATEWTSKVHYSNNTKFSLNPKEITPSTNMGWKSRKMSESVKKVYIRKKWRNVWMGWKSKLNVWMRIKRKNVSYGQK